MINTRGFGVDVMPRYTAPDINLMTPDYSQITKGVLDAFKVASEKDKLEAFRHQQQELDALRADRIAAARARFSGDVRTEGESAATSANRVGAENAKNLTTIQVAPEQTKLSLADIANRLALAPGANKIALDRQAADIEALPDERTIKLNRTAADVAASEAGVAAADDLASSTIANAKLAKGKADYGLATEADREALDYSKLQDELANAQTDQELARVAAKLKNQLIQSQVNENDARARFNLGSGRQTGTAPRDRTLSEIAMLDRSIDTTMKRFLANGKTVQAYIEERDKTDPDTLTSDGEAAVETLHQLHAEKDATLQQALQNRQSARAAGKTVEAPVEVHLPGAAGGPTVFDTPAKGGPMEFSSVAEAQKAFDNGEIAVGDKIIVGGKSGTWK